MLSLTFIIGIVGGRALELEFFFKDFIVESFLDFFRKIVKMVLTILINPTPSSLYCFF